MSTLKDIFSRIRTSRIGLIFCLTILSIFFIGFKSVIVKPINSSVPALKLDDLPMTLGDWTGTESAGLDIRSLDILRLTSYVRRRYTNSEGQSVFVYIGYWATQSGEYQAAKHSPALCLPSNGWQTSHLDNYLYSNADLNLESPIEIRRLIGQKRTNSELFYYWFFAGDNYYSKEWYALIELSLANLLYGRNDGGIVEVSTDISHRGSQEKSEETLREFLGLLVPFLHNRIRDHQETKTE